MYTIPSSQQGQAKPLTTKISQRMRTEALQDHILNYDLRLVRTCSGHREIGNQLKGEKEKSIGDTGSLWKM